MGADTFIRVGSCGTYQEYVNCGDVIISTGTFRAAGTAHNYLPVEFPAVPTFEITAALVNASKTLGLEAHVGLGLAGDAFYSPRGERGDRDLMKQPGLVSVEMESDTLFVLAALRGWRAGALYACDGTASEIKPDWCEAAFQQGEETAIRIVIAAMKKIAMADATKHV